MDARGSNVGGPLGVCLSYIRDGYPDWDAVRATRVQRDVSAVPVFIAYAELDCEARTTPVHDHGGEAPLRGVGAAPTDGSRISVEPGRIYGAATATPDVPPERDESTSGGDSMIGFVVWLFVAQQVSPLGSVPPNPIVEWTQDAETVEEVQGYVYKYYLDGAQTGAVLVGVICTGTARPWPCRASLPVTAGGPHTLTMTAERTTGEVGPMCPPVTFTIELIGAPTSPGPVIIIK
jgi:hypothetical protein